MLDAVAFADPSHGLAVGRSFGERDHDPTSPHPLFLITSDGGVTWARPTFPWEEYSFALRDVCMTARGTALIPGFGYAGELVAVSGDFGASWRDVTTDAAFSFGISVGAACLEDGNLWLVGYRSVLQSPDDGATWLAHAATFPNDVPVLDDVAFVDATRAFSIHRDVILSSTDPGVAWAREAQPYDGTEATFSGIAATRSTVLVGGSRAVSDGRIGIVLVRDLRQLGWSEAELPVGTDTITDVALAPLP